MLPIGRLIRWICLRRGLHGLAALAEVSGWLGFLPVEAVTATEVVAMKLPGQGCLEDLAKSATATTSKKSARTEGAEAFFVGTHDPEAIAIAIKL
jgi:hypothetical protein